ncbi:MAG: VCBS repeat-containing protein, partial [Acetobacteraceae bacterium]|nr:VCBS repeat-containing protein [Acetobacteraceae bacterium]
ALATAAFGAGAAGGGWTDFNRYPRFVADVNGDSFGDLVGFGEVGTYVAFGTGTGGFGALTLATTAFGAGPAGGSWTSYDRYPRRPADVNGDGRDDLVGFGENGTYVALANPGGQGGFGGLTLGTAAFGAGPGAGTWSSFNLYPRRLGDVNGDSRADIVGFGENGTYVALGEFDAPGQFQAFKLGIANFGSGAAGGGWTSYERYPRELSEIAADVNGDRIEDIVGFGENGTYVALGTFSGNFI